MPSPYPVRLQTAPTGPGENIKLPNPVRLQTAPTGPGENIKLPNPVRLQTAPTGPGENIKLPIYFLKLHQTSPALVEAGLLNMGLRIFCILWWII